MGQHEGVRAEGAHLGADLAEDGLHTVRAGQSTLTARSLHLDTVDLDGWPMLAVPDHSGLNHFSEGCLLKMK